MDIVLSSDSDFIQYGVHLAAFWDCGDELYYYPRVLFCDKQS